MPSGTEPKPGLHPRNRHRDGYDFAALVRSSPELGGFVRPNPFGSPSIDFADPDAVRALNRALLRQGYGVDWNLPAGFLCPPIPGRADYLHYAADLLAGGGAIPRGAATRVLDIGTGASCIYPLLGHREYGWSFLCSDIDPAALAAAGRILRANPGLAGRIELRLQADPGKIFQGLLRAGTRRKLRNLGLGAGAAAPKLNFGGRGAELWCPGGEAGFIGRMISESARTPGRIRWLSTLVSKSANLPPLLRALDRAGAEARVLPMAQGQKQSRILAWRFPGQ